MERKPERFRPAFMIKAVAIPSRDLDESHYLDSNPFNLIVHRPVVG